MKLTMDNWIAFDLEWEPSGNNVVLDSRQSCNNSDFTSSTSVPPAQDYHKILTFGYEDSYGDNGTFDISDFKDRPDPGKAFLAADYKKGINPNLFAANILFIDLDEKNFECREELDRWLKRIQKNIANVLYNTRPLVLWSGHGYHIILSVKATRALEQFEDFKPYTKEPSKEFLQFAERHLSLNKSDPANNPSFKSCLLRVPYTFNSKCIEEGAADAAEETPNALREHMQK